MKQPHEAMTEMLTTKLQKFLNEPLNRGTCIQIYNVLFESLQTITSGLNLEITNEGMNYLAQLYYDSVLVSGNKVLDPNIFTQRAKLENISTKELVVMSAFVNRSPFAVDIIKEIKRRS